MKAVHVCMFVIVFGARAGAVAAQDPGGAANPSVCVAIDETKDMLSADDRRAALILVARQFERAGRQVVTGNCAERYSIAHVRLGRTIVVTLTGPVDQREATAAGIEDLPAVYGEIVRALLTGSPVDATTAAGSTDVTAGHAPVQRTQVDCFGYARLGYGAVMATGGSSSPAIGFGYRAELDSFALDISFLNEQLPSSNDAYDASGAIAASLLKLEALYFAKPKTNASAYVGGGVSWGATALSSASSPAGYSSWSGSGLQGELTAGYELPRASGLRFFIQADGTLPFYRVTDRTFTSSTSVVVARRYAPSIAISVGMGWQRRRL